MRYLQYGQIKTTNRQFQTFRDLKSEKVGQVTKWSQKYVFL